MNMHKTSVPASGDQPRRAYTRDGLMTFDQATYDSAGAFLIQELERLDQTLHEPLYTVTWPRDIDLREDVQMGDEASAWTISSFAAAGGINPTGKNWIGKDSSAISGISVDIGKSTLPMYLWGMELGFTVIELISSQQLGRPIDDQKYEGLKIKYNMDADAQMNVGDTGYGLNGLLNQSSSNVTNQAVVANGATGYTPWTSKTPDEMLFDVNTLVASTWGNSGWALVPPELRLPPIQFNYLLSQKVSTAGNVSILEFLRNNSLSNAHNGKPLNILPVKWLTGLGVASSNRMICYTRDKNRVRWPIVPLQRTPIQYKGIFQLTMYYGRLGAVETVYPETIGYADGI